MAIEIQDAQYYPEKAVGGHTMTSSVASGGGTLETHEFYNKDGKVIYYWKLKKDAAGEVTDFRIKLANPPADPAVAYEDFDSIS